MVDRVWQLAHLPLTQWQLLAAARDVHWLIASLGLLIGAAWFATVTGNSRRWAGVIEIAAFVLGLLTLAWFFRYPGLPWDQSTDWHNAWSYFSALQQAAQRGELPYHLRTAVQGTERYFANLEAVLAPHALMLRWIPLNAFFMLHVALCYAVGFAGLVVLRRQLSLSLFVWTVYLTILLLNGHITSHFYAGHTQWAAYYLLPWVFVALVALAGGDASLRTAVILAATLGTMVLIGGWHVFVWSVLFTGFVGLTSWKALRFVARVAVMTAALIAVRLLPGLLTYGAGQNKSIGGFPSLDVLLSALVGEATYSPAREWWEFETYVGLVGFLLLWLGVSPFGARARLLRRALWVPSMALVVLSMYRIYEVTLFNLPGFVSQRVATRLLIIPVLVLTLLGCVTANDWLSGRSGWRSWRSLASLAAGWWLAVQLALRTAIWRVPFSATAPQHGGDVLKTAAEDPPYFWSVWIGMGITALALAILVPAALKDSRRTRLPDNRSGSSRTG